MVHKDFCDICGAEITWRDECSPRRGGYFQCSKNQRDLCVDCANAIERFIKELKEKHQAVLNFRKDPHIKGQKELGDFE